MFWRLSFCQLFPLKILSFSCFVVFKLYFGSGFTSQPWSLSRGRFFLFYINHLLLFFFLLFQFFASQVPSHGPHGHPTHLQRTVCMWGGGGVCAGGPRRLDAGRHSSAATFSLQLVEGPEGAKSEICASLRPGNYSSRKRAPQKEFFPNPACVGSLPRKRTTTALKITQEIATRIFDLRVFFLAKVFLISFFLIFLFFSTSGGGGITIRTLHQ